MRRRDFLRVLAAAAACGAPVRASLAQTRQALYDLPPFGNVSLLHFTDCHAQLLPVYFREPSVNLGTGENKGKPPHLVGKPLLRRFGIARGSRAAYAFSHVDFEALAQRYGVEGSARRVVDALKA